MNSVAELVKGLSHKRIHIVGFSSAEGSAVLEFLLLHKVDCDLTLHDSYPKENLLKTFQESHKELTAEESDEKFRFITSLPYQYHYADEYLAGIETAEIIFVTQAWSIYKNNAPLKLLQGKIPFLTMTNLYFDLSPCEIIGVTGTNGKSSTAKLISEMFEASELKSYFAGNDRLNKQVLDRLDEMKKGENFVLEISNRQLMGLEKSPNIAVYTNVTQDHIDDHGSYDEYIAVKRKLTAFQNKTDTAILNLDDAIVSGFADTSPSQNLFYTLGNSLPKGKNGAYVHDGQIVLSINNQTTPILAIDEMWQKGKHNVANAMAASLTAFLAGIPVSIIKNVLKTSTGLRYRNQFVKTIRGVDYYNDLNSTVPEATIAAFSSFDDRGIYLIVGGEDKGLNYSPLAQAISEYKVKKVLALPGNGTDKILAALEAVDSPQGLVEHFNTLDEVVRFADANASEGDVVLLSPACAYFFSRYTKLVTEGDESWLNVLTAQ